MKRILCLGDSNTYGHDPRSYLPSRYPPGVRWTGLLRTMGWEVANCGQNGLCIPREAQFPEVVSLLRRAGRLDVAAVMLGHNDLLSGASAEETAARMDALMDCVTANDGDAVALLIAPPPLRPGDWVQSELLIDESVRYARRCRAVADRPGAAFADAGEWGVEMTFDGVHFSPEGHAAFARGLAAALDALI